MIAAPFHKGSGLGDQLFRYITVRTLAEEKGYEWGMVNPTNFKGASFMDIDTGKPVNLLNPIAWDEKDVRDTHGNDIRSYDPEINFVKDNTIVDGCFEDFKYWGHNLDNIDSWLKVDPITIPNDTCVIGFRGGEYYTDPTLGLPKEYYDDAMVRMQLEHPFVRKFEVHTDDPSFAQQFFPDFPIIQDIGINWRSMRYAKHAIIANSAFYIIPRLLSGGITYAPRYWARRNIQTWSRPACYYKQFQYV